MESPYDLDLAYITVLESRVEVRHPVNIGQKFVA